GPPPLQTLLQRLLSGPRPCLLSLGLSLLLLVGICAIASQNSKLQRDLVTLTTTFSNFISNTSAEIRALNFQDGTLQGRIASLNTEVEGQKQQLQQSLNDKVLSLESRLEKEQKELQTGYSEMLLRVQQLVETTDSLTCRMSALKSHDSRDSCCPTDWLEHRGSCYWFSGSEKEEQNFIQAHMGSFYTWMGLSDPDRVWKWADGTDYETNFQNWKPGEDCAHLHPDGMWNDDACQRPYHWICEARLSKAS
uniref:C-type lectin domain containing 10A n=1 Tax=Sus scrofa TaxID=9823 RepID=A0A8W4FIV6_PIG